MQLDSKLPVIFITAGGDSDTAIEAMKLGAFDYVLKPLDVHVCASWSSRPSKRGGRCRPGRVPGPENPRRRPPTS
jgi:DNA-binding NtrC family response regulator